MKPFFIFLLFIPVALAIMPGEKVGTYTNITNVTYPCYNIGDDVYVYGNVSIGVHVCDITYYKFEQEQIIITSGGGRRSYVSNYNNVKSVNVTSSNRTVKVKPIGIPLVESDDINNVILPEYNGTVPNIEEFNATFISNNTKKQFNDYELPEKIQMAFTVVGMIIIVFFIFIILLTLWVFRK